MAPPSRPAHAGGLDPVAASLVRALVDRGLTVATAESLTGGAVGERLTTVPGASRTYVGGVVTYATRVKVDLLGVPAELVERVGVVSEGCAAAMASGVRRLLDADLGLATTGVAGPDRQEDKPPGLVYVAVADRSGTVVRELRLAGDRGAVRAGAVRAVLTLAHTRVANASATTATE